MLDFMYFVCNQMEKTKGISAHACCTDYSFDICKAL